MEDSLTPGLIPMGNIVIDDGGVTHPEGDGHAAGLIPISNMVDGIGGVTDPDVIEVAATDLMPMSNSVGSEGGVTPVDELSMTIDLIPIVNMSFNGAGGGTVAWFNHMSEAETSGLMPILNTVCDLGGVAPRHLSVLDSYALLLMPMLNAVMIGDGVVAHGKDHTPLTLL